jgi:pimeloyl-ACP methyl ester carboxylesterase
LSTDSRLSSSDGVSLAVHDYNPESHLRTVLFSHATGFHGRVFDPVASALISTNHCITFDYRGYGDSTCPPDWQVEWAGYGDDALAAARHAARNGQIIGAGHSMGGAALVMAALREPQLFRTLVLFEPIIFPLATPDQQRGGPSPLVEGARRRRAVFASFGEALANYSSKPPLNVFDAAALRAYVMFGFRPQPDGSVALKCSPEHEARTYETGANHETWNELGKLTVPTWVISGADTPTSPANIAPAIAAQIPGAMFVRYEQLTHFGPMQDPQTFAECVRVADAATR